MSHLLHHHNQSLPHRHCHLHGVVADDNEAAVVVAVEVIVEMLVVVVGVAAMVVAVVLLEVGLRAGGEYCDIVGP